MNKCKLVAKEVSFLLLPILFIGLIAAVLPQLNAKTTAKKSPTKITQPLRPPVGLYKVTVFNKEPSATTSGVELVAIDVSFKWLRLFKNGTYKTDQANQVEGRYFYNVKTSKFAFRPFKAFDRDPNFTFNSPYYIFRDTSPEYSYYKETGHVLLWGHSNSLRGGQVECHWEKP